jgi:hypothetical protein
MQEQPTKQLTTYDISTISKTCYCVEHKGSFTGEWYPVLGFETLERAQAYAANGQGQERRVTTFAIILSQEAK